MLRTFGSNSIALLPKNQYLERLLDYFRKATEFSEELRPIKTPSKRKWIFSKKKWFPKNDEESCRVLVFRGFTDELRVKLTGNGIVRVF